jgi:hypothetical protein
VQKYEEFLRASHDRATADEKVRSVISELQELSEKVQSISHAFKTALSKPVPQESMDSIADLKDKNNMLQGQLIEKDKEIRRFRSESKATFERNTELEATVKSLQHELNEASNKS